MKVLLATDGNEPSIRAARLIAGMLAGGSHEVMVLSVLSFDAYPYVLVPGEHLSDEHAREKEAEVKVERLIAPIREVLVASGLSVATDHRFGNPTDEIVRYAEEWGAELVVLGRRGVRGLERWIGSVSEHTLRNVKVPVLVVP
jgi:nucleotide-binding universal stress UspA family protein